MKKKKKRQGFGWGAVALILGISATIDIFVPDPIPFVDEVLLIAGTILAFIMSWRRN